MHQLRALGISAEAEAIYVDLMARGALTVEEVADGTPGSVDGLLEELAAVGLIERSDGSCSSELVVGWAVSRSGSRLRRC